MGLVLGYDSWKYIHPILPATQYILLEEKGLKLTHGTIRPCMKEKEKYGARNDYVRTNGSLGWCNLLPVEGDILIWWREKWCIR